mmetsp:Transcript_106978/g.209707  ORF Transcript_106978/g.209707 Transcript_106978/m.209707 type:complete len:234 (-) Transcript_106978:113-814(-)
MIHIFNGCREICSLPGKLCTACGDCCRSINCSPIEDCCKAVGQGCSQFTEKPLSSFVILAWVMSAVELYYCVDALEAVGKCKFRGGGESVGLGGWLYVQMGFAILNIIFAPWFQHQVWQAMLAGMSGTQTPGGYHVKAQVVQGAFKQVFLNDFGVLFYFFALMGSFVWAWEGKSWMATGIGCNMEGPEAWAYWMGLCFFWTAFFFSFCWYYCSCCAGSVTLKDAPHQPLGQGP